jgi:hypothetical protein
MLNTKIRLVILMNDFTDERLEWDIMQPHNENSWPKTQMKWCSVMVKPQHGAHEVPHCNHTIPVQLVLLKLNRKCHNAITP